MPYVVLDIETIPDTSLNYVPKNPDEFPPPPVHEVVTIGIMLLGDDYTPQKLGVVPGVNERERLAEFIKIASRRVDMVSWNGRGFDLPVIVARSLKHGLQFSRYYNEKNVRYRFSSEGHFDVKDYLGDYGAVRVPSLDVAAKLVGFPGKVGVDGSKVAEMVASGAQADVDAYCLCDVVQTAAIFLRTQHLRGQIYDFERVSGHFRTFVEGEARVSAVANLVNWEGFANVQS